MLRYFILFCIAFSFSCIQSSNEKLLNKLELEIKTNLSKDDYWYDVSKITDFDWDVLYTLGPYSTRELIKSHTRLGNNDLGKIKTTISNSDGITLFIFLKNQRLVEYFEISRGIADFASTKEIIKNNAKFKLIKEKNKVAVEWKK